MSFILLSTRSKIFMPVYVTPSHSALYEISADFVSASFEVSIVTVTLKSVFVIFSSCILSLLSILARISLSFLFTSSSKA